jgi:hypothetical protein
MDVAGAGAGFGATGTTAGAGAGVGTLGAGVGAGRGVGEGEQAARINSAATLERDARCINDNHIRGCDWPLLGPRPIFAPRGPIAPFAHLFELKSETLCESVRLLRP